MLQRPTTLTNIINEDDLNDDLSTLSKNNEVIVVQVSADWCSPCKKMKGIVFNSQTNQGLATEYVGRVKFFYIDYDQSKEFAEFYKINSVPTFMIGRLNQKGKFNFTILKGANKEGLVEKIKTLLK